MKSTGMIKFGQIKAVDMTRYRSMAPQDALDAFMAEYVIPFSTAYTEYVQGAMKIAQGVLTDAELSSVGISITSASVAFKEAQKKIYAQFIDGVYGDAAMAEMSITNPAVIQAIKGNTITTYNGLIDGALSQTSRDVVDTIRKYQRDLIEGQNKITAAEKFAKASAEEVAALKKQIQKDIIKNNPDFMTMVDNGNFVRYRDGKLVNFDAYNEMATRTTALNVQRDAVEMQQAIDGERISAYVLLDPRPLKTDARPICKRILANKWHGVALIAHDQAAADVFGILTVAQAKAQGAMGPNCRHGLEPLSEGMSNMVDNILYVADIAGPEEGAA